MKDALLIWLLTVVSAMWLLLLALDTEASQQATQAAEDSLTHSICQEQAHWARIAAEDRDYQGLTYHQQLADVEAAYQQGEMTPTRADTITAVVTYVYRLPAKSPRTIERHYYTNCLEANP